MKNYLFFFFAICLLFSTQDAMADDYITDSYGVVYMISGNEAMVVNADRYNLNRIEVEIKSYVSDKAGRNWYAVTTLKDGWLKDVKKTIERITLPKTLKELPVGCFKGCKNLKIVDFSGNPTKLNYIPGGCFEGCSNLQSFTIPESVQAIGAHCFKDCFRLTTIKIPNSVIKIQNECFQNSGIKKIKLPSSLERIEPYCFANCDMLDSIEIPKTCNFIGDHAFEKCYSLAAVTFAEPSNLKQIFPNCFSGCVSLKSITLPNSVGSISSYCFYNCTSLQSVTLGESTARLEYNSFGNCNNLKTIYCLAATPPSQSEGFGPYAPFLANVTLYVPDESLSLYKKYNEDSQPSYRFGAVLPLSVTGIKTIDTEGISLDSDNGTVTITGVPSSMPASIYSASGQLLGTGKGNISVNAQGAQMVIVKVGGKSYKMLAK